MIEISDYEKKVLSNPELVAALDRAKEQVERGDVVVTVRKERVRD